LDQFNERVDYEWGGLKSTGYPQHYPKWVERLKEQVDLWLHDEAFEYLGFRKDHHFAEDARELSVFGLTERFALKVQITRDPQNPGLGNVRWELVPRSAITSLNATHVPAVAGGRWLVIDAEFGAIKAESFPEREDTNYDADARRAIFDGLRADLYPR